MWGGACRERELCGDGWRREGWRREGRGGRRGDDGARLLALFVVVVVVVVVGGWMEGGVGEVINELVTVVEMDHVATFSC